MLAKYKGNNASALEDMLKSARKQVVHVNGGFVLFTYDQSMKTN